MNITEISGPIEKHLDSFNKYFKSLMLTDVSLLNLIINYITKKKGKQVRPVLVFLSAELCGGANERTNIGAAMIELLHTATLIHDDVVDKSSQRRGMASINAEWSNKIAVLIGDYLLARGLLSAIDHSEFNFLRATSKAVRRMSEGELLQIEKSMKIDTDEETYFKIISYKTASLMSSCCEIGALSATDDSEKHLALSRYGELVGLSFQIRDDIFDYANKSSIIGKPVGNDLKEKKLTLPLIYSFKQVSKGEAKDILKIIKGGKLKKADITKVVDFVKVNGGLDYAEKKAKELSIQGVEAISGFADCPAKDSLIKYANFVIERST
ncbi:MAG: Polyprenyl synthetase family protein [Bacteroidota bacterium]|nr:Polyprenyl synthetase family protein [Bacteroidota bacterium]